MTNNRHRVWQVDFIRGIAVVGMVFYHFMWDMMFFGLYPHDVTVGGWRAFARTVAATFVFLMGVSMALTAARKPSAERDRQWLERGVKLLGWGVVISVVTRLVLGDAFILYGILHLAGTAFLLAPLLWRARRVAPLLGVAAIVFGAFLDDRAGSFDVLVPYAIPLGVRPALYPAVDYFPVFPWLGVIMLGMSAGRRLVPFLANMRADRPAPPALAHIAAVGRNSLLIYIVHQPVLFAAFLLFGALAR